MAKEQLRVDQEIAHLRARAALENDRMQQLEAENKLSAKQKLEYEERMIKQKQEMDQLLQGSCIF